MAKPEKSVKGKGKSSQEELITGKDIKGIGLALSKAVNAEIARCLGGWIFLQRRGVQHHLLVCSGPSGGLCTHSARSGVQGSASIGGVAPGIAEALIATAAGLFAAIPAVVFLQLPE